MAQKPKYGKELLEKAAEYIDIYQELGQIIPSHVGLARHIGVHKSTLYEWRKNKNKKPMADILADIKDHQEMVLLNGGLCGLMNSNIVKLALGKHGYKDSQAVEHAGEDGKALTAITLQVIKTGE